MAHLASLDYALEHVDRPAIARDEDTRRIRTQEYRLQCLADIESAEAELSGLLLCRDSLADFVRGYEYIETKETLEEEIRLLEEQLDELKEILRELEDA